MKKQTRSHDKGSVLVTVMAMMVVIMAVSGSVLAIISHEYVMSKRSVAWNQSLNTAETGIEFGWNELNKLTAVNTNGVFMTGAPWTTSVSGIWNTASNQTLTPVVGSEASTTYSVTVNTNNWSITATGTASSSLIASTVSRTVRVTVNPTTPFEWGILAKGLIDFNGNTPLVDSWNSDADGVYDSGDQRGNGNIGTDGSLIDAGGLDVWGSMVTGPNGTVNTGAGFSLNSDEHTRASPTNTITDGLEVYIPSVSAPWAKGTSGVATGTSPIAVSGNAQYEMGDVNGSISFTGSGVITLYVDSINQNGNEGLFITPDSGENLQVIIYVKNELDLAGNDGMNEGGKASNLIIYGLPTCTSVEIGGNKEFCGAIYAPDADARIHGTAGYYGALVCKTLDFNGTGDFHYDEALDTVGGIVGFSLVSWHEQ